MLDRATPKVEIPEFRDAVGGLLPVPAKWRNKVSAHVGQVGTHWARGWHTGTDFAVPAGTPVFASWGGLCTYAEDTRGREGLMVKIRSSHPTLGPIDFICMHLSGLYARAGRMVKAGEIIGLSGNSGTFEKNARGSFHCHVQISKGSGSSREFFRPVFA